MIETIEISPCPIEQSFNKKLLTTPFPKYSDSLWLRYIYIKLKLEHRAKYSDKKYQRFAELERRFLDLYERAKDEEENPKKLPRNKAEGPLYFPWFTHRGRGNLYFRLAQRTAKLSSKFIDNAKNEKV